MAATNDTRVSVIETIEWTGDVHKPQQVRLRAALLDAQRRLASAKAKLGNSATATAVLLASAKCVQKAEEEARRSAFYSAWDCMHQFDSEMLAAMDAEELDAHWISLMAEGQEKLTGWRSKTAIELIKQFGEKKPVPLAIVRVLQSHLATTAQNRQFKMHLFDQSIPILTGFLLIVVLGVLGTAIYVKYYGGLLYSQDWASALTLGIAAGALGGLLSMAFSLGRVNMSAKTPDIQLSGLVTSMRPILGAAVAIPVLIFVESKYIRIGGFEPPLSTFAFCFLAGFSERWFLGLMERFESESSKK
jgi:hypothetical protein